MNVVLRAALLLSSSAAASVAQTNTPPRDFEIESAHTTVTFKVGFLGLPVHGRFDEVHGVIAYVARDVPSSAVSVVIPTKSISTGSTHRDEHLRSADFFEIDKYPYLTFHSTSIQRRGSGFVAKGPLTMHGVTHDVEIPFAMQPPIEEPHGSTLLVFVGGLRISRKDFGILGGSKFNEWFDSIRSATMADSVDISLEVQAWDPDYTRSTKYDAPLDRIARQGIDSLLASLRARFRADPNVFADSEWELTQIGRALLARHKPDDALKMLRFTVEVLPRSLRSHTTLARALEATGNLPAAVEEARKAAAIDPLDPASMELLRRLAPLRR